MDHSEVIKLQRPLALDPRSIVRLELAERSSVHPYIQMELAKDEALGVRATLAKNDRITEEVALVLAEDHDVTVLRELARNAALTGRVIRALHVNPDPMVRARLLANPELVLDDQFKVTFLMLSPAGKKLVKRQLAGHDKETRTALATSWDGTLEDLVIAVEMLGPERIIETSAITTDGGDGDDGDEKRPEVMVETDRTKGSKKRDGSRPTSGKSDAKKRKKKSK